MGFRQDDPGAGLPECPARCKPSMEFNIISIMRHRAQRREGDPISLLTPFIRLTLSPDARVSGPTHGHSHDDSRGPGIMVLAAPEKNHGSVHVPMMDATERRNDCAAAG